MVFLEICKSFQLMSKGLEAKKKYCVEGVISKHFKKKWDGNLRDMESKCRDLLLEEHCTKLFYLMNCFWKAIVDGDADISWLVKVRNYLDQIEKEQAKTKRKKLASPSRNYRLKRMVLKRFHEHLPHFQFKSDFLLYCNSLCPELENLWTLVTINKTSKHPKGESASSQTCQDDINLTKALNKEEKSNNSIDSTGNCSEPGTQANDHQDIDTALRLEGKFVSKNVFNLSRKNLSPPEISSLSKRLKFVPLPNKIDREKLKGDLEEYGRKLRLMWHFRNDKQTFTAEKFRPKSSFNPRNKDATTETYLNCLEKRLIDRHRDSFQKT